MKKNDDLTRYLTLITSLFMISAVMMAAGCDMLLPAAPLPPTATATQTLTPTVTIDWFPATATSTGLPTATPTPQPTLAGRPGGVTELRFADDFSDKTLWTAPQSLSGNVAYGNGNLNLAPAQKGSYLFSLSPYQLPSDFYLEITIQTTLCQGDDQFGLVFWRQSEGDFYRMLFNCEGEYRLELVQGGISTVIHDWEVAGRIQPGAPATNLIGLWVAKGSLRLYVNDTFQFEESVARERTGDLGLFARPVSGNAMTVRVSDLKVYQVSSEE